MRYSAVMVIGVATLMLAACSHRVSESVLPLRGQSGASRDPLTLICGMDSAALAARGIVLVLVPTETATLKTPDFPNGAPPYVFGNPRLNVATTPPAPATPTELTLSPGAGPCNSMLSPERAFTNLAR